MSLPWFTWFLVLLAATILFLCGISLWDTLNGLWEHSAVLGMAGLMLTGLLVLVITAVAIQEWQAMEKINTLEEIRQQAEHSLASSDDVGDLDSAKEVIDRLVAIYSSRDDTRGGAQRLVEEEKRDESSGAIRLFIRAETEILTSFAWPAPSVKGLPMQLCWPVRVWLQWNCAVPCPSALVNAPLSLLLTTSSGRPSGP